MKMSGWAGLGWLALACFQSHAKPVLALGILSAESVRVVACHVFD